MNTNLPTLLFTLVNQIPQGKVTTYGLLAQVLKLKTPRQVGWLLHRNTSPENAPCHRVVFADGKLSGNYAFGGAEAQRKWLESEGVLFKNAKVDLKECLWFPPGLPQL